MHYYNSDYCCKWFSFFTTKWHCSNMIHLNGLNSNVQLITQFIHVYILNSPFQYLGIL